MSLERRNGGGLERTAPIRPSRAEHDLPAESTGTLPESSGIPKDIERTRWELQQQESHEAQPQTSTITANSNGKKEPLIKRIIKNPYIMVPLVSVGLATGIGFAAAAAIFAASGIPAIISIPGWIVFGSGVSALILRGELPPKTPRPKK